MSAQIVAGYELLDRLAVGGMGEVFRARKVAPGGFAKVFALKRLLPEVARSPDLVAMFFEEARLAASLSSPGLVQVFDFGEESGLPYLVMELVEGTDLAALLARGPLPAPLAVHVAASLAQTLGNLHQAGVIHRDVTPSNVLISRGGAVKLTDLGIAKARAGGRRTEPGAVKGKLRYLAPEQMRGEEADARTDLYMLGLVLFEALAGEPFLRAETDAALIQAAQKPVFRAPSSLCASAPGTLDEVVRRALHPEREQRYPSVELFRRALAESGTLPEIIEAERALGSLAAGSAPAAVATAAQVARPERRVAARPKTELLEPESVRSSITASQGAWLPARARRRRFAIGLLVGLGLAGIAAGWASRPPPAVDAPTPAPTAEIEPAPHVANAPPAPPAAVPARRPAERPPSSTQSATRWPAPSAPRAPASAVASPPIAEPTSPRAEPSPGPDVAGARERLAAIEQAVSAKGLLPEDAPALFEDQHSLAKAIARGEAPLDELDALARQVSRLAIDRGFINAKIERLSQKVARLPLQEQARLKAPSQAALTASLAGRFEQANRHLNVVAGAVER